VLKVRPPLVFGPEHVDVFARTLDDVLGESGNGAS
jgi:4-aminobutyrate aminotransferase-like enzyme